LQHTFASRLVMARVDCPTVQELMAYKDITMTLRYTYFSNDHPQCAVRVFAWVEDEVLVIFTPARVRDVALFPYVSDFKLGR